jgi:eukaryotic-like serine/threonine-protein kinase
MIIYRNLGQIEKALVEAQEELRLDPGSANAYGNLASTYRGLNQLEDSKRILDEAAARHLETDQLVLNRYLLAFLMDDVNEMQRIVTAAADNPKEADEIFSTHGDTEAYHGRFGQAREWLRRAVEAAKSNGDAETAAGYYVAMALQEVEAGNMDQARRDIDAGMALAVNRDMQVEAALVLSRTGDIARSRSIIEDLEKKHPTDTLLNTLWLPTIEASLELQQGNQARALDLLQTAQAYELSSMLWGAVMYAPYLRGQAYLLAHDPKQAAAEFQKILDHRGVVINRLQGARAHLELGRAYVMAGEPDKARIAYQDFLVLWKQADPEIPILKQAKMEYAKLQ